MRYFLADNVNHGFTISHLTLRLLLSIPFLSSGVERNPTEDIIVELAKHNDLVDLPEAWSMETFVLEVSVSSVQSFHRELKSQQTDADCILIHLGVDMMTDQPTVKLEQCESFRY